MKLKDFCKKAGISYITGYRWFKDGKMPVPAYQTESGTILVDDVESPDQADNSMELFLKKTIEFSNNNSSIEEFAAWILSNFTLKVNNQNLQEQFNDLSIQSLMPQLESQSDSQINNYANTELYNEPYNIASANFTSNTTSQSYIGHDILRYAQSNNIGSICLNDGLSNFKEKFSRNLDQNEAKPRRGRKSHKNKENK